MTLALLILAWLLRILLVVIFAIGVLSTLLFVLCLVATRYELDEDNERPVS